LKDGKLFVSVKVKMDKIDFYILIHRAYYEKRRKGDKQNQGTHDKKRGYDYYISSF